MKFVTNTNITIFMNHLMIIIQEAKTGCHGADVLTSLSNKIQCTYCLHL